MFRLLSSRAQSRASNSAHFNTYCHSRFSGRFASAPILQPLLQLMVNQHRITTHREGAMVRPVLILSVLLLFIASPILAEVNWHYHAQSPLHPKAITTVTLNGDAFVLTFVPIDLPADHTRDL